MSVDLGLLDQIRNHRSLRVELNVFPDRTLIGVITRTVNRADTTFTLIGAIEGQPGSSVLLSVNHDVLVGEIRTAAREHYQIRYIRGGVHEVRQVDDSQYPPCGGGIPRDLSLAPATAALSASADDGSLIDLLILYTPAARAAAGGTSAIEAIANLTVDQANFAFMNSLIVPRMRLVAQQETDYVESGSYDTDLENLRGTSDGFMDDVHALRDEVGADMVSLLFVNSEVCGVAYLMTSLSPSFASDAFSLVVWECLDYILAHELGHNLGSQHAVGDAGLTREEETLFTYSYGWRFNSGRDRTIMAYDPGTRQPYFSNPYVRVNAGAAGVPIGDPDEAYNAQSINNVATTAANWRPAVPVLVYFADSNLESAILDASGRPTGPIYDTDLLDLTSLVANGLAISDLTGLEYAINLTTLDLSGNQISDLGALQRLTRLTYLDLSGNQISDVGPLLANAGIGNGDFVDLRSNPLNEDAICNQVLPIKARGATIEWDASGVDLCGAPAGAVIGWGLANYGATPPDTVNGVSGTATRIAAGSRHSCAIQAGTGKVICWGYNYYGEGTPPDAVNGITGTASDIAAGEFHSCAIQAGTGKVVCWGDDSYGQSTPPDAVNGISGTATDISSSVRYACAIQAGTGSVVCWGSNTYSKATPPDAVNGISGTATEISSGGRHSCAIQAGTGNAVCWGDDSYGESTPPDAVNGISGTATHISAGSTHSCAIQAGTGNVVCWGYDYSGQSTPPDAVSGIMGTASVIELGQQHSCAIQAGTGSVVCWGYVYSHPTPPNFVNGVWGGATDIAAGDYHTLAIALPEPVAWLSQPAGLALLGALYRSRARKRRRRQASTFPSESLFRLAAPCRCG